MCVNIVLISYNIIRVDKYCMHAHSFKAALTLTDGTTRTLHAHSFFRCSIWNDTGYSACAWHLCACIWRARATSTVGYLLHACLNRAWPGGMLERVSETSPGWCGHKDVLHLNKCNPFQEERDWGSSCERVDQPQPRPCVNCIKLLIRTKMIACFN